MHNTCMPNTQEGQKCMKVPQDLELMYSFEPPCVLLEFNPDPQQ